METESLVDPLSRKTADVSLWSHDSIGREKPSVTMATEPMKSVASSTTSLPTSAPLAVAKVSKVTQRNMSYIEACEDVLPSYSCHADDSLSTSSEEFVESDTSGSDTDSDQEVNIIFSRRSPTGKTISLPRDIKRINVESRGSPIGRRRPVSREAALTVRRRFSSTREEKNQYAENLRVSPQQLLSSLEISTEQPEIPTEQPEIPTEQPEIPTCLLYTSDAADE